MRLIQVIICLGICLPLVEAFADDEFVRGFDDIVADLAGESRQEHGPISTEDDVHLYLGFGLTSSYVTVDPEFGSHGRGLLKGFEMSLGIDLFSENWMAEASARSFDSAHINSEMEVGLREFDLKALYHAAITDSIQIRTGGGLAARYLEFGSRQPVSVAARTSYTTPASIVFAGISGKLSRQMSLGSDLSYRNSLIQDTIDRSAWTAALRLDAQF